MASPGGVGRMVGLGVLLFVVGLGGVGAGLWARDRFAPRPIVDTRAPRSLLRIGMPFPDLALNDEAGASRSSVEMLGDRGAVVLFLDLECPPCVDMANKWEETRLTLPDLRVLGISNHSPEVAAEFRQEHHLGFPILTDAEQGFLETYEVNRFPLEVVVGADGKIRFSSYDSETVIEPEKLRQYLGG